MPSFTGRQTVNWSAQLWHRPQLNYTCNSEAVDTYWNHNTAYHPWILRQAASCAARDAVDVGCGEGLLVERLAGVGINVVGLEPDPAAATRARLRLADQPRAQVLQLDFVSFQPSEQSYDLVTFVASLHHLDAEVAFRQARTWLRPGGMLLVVGLAANKSLSDWCWSAGQFPAARLGSWWRRETRDLGVQVAPPTMSVAEVRALARRLLPGARLRRGLYYRYLLSWRRP